MDKNGNKMKDENRMQEENDDKEWCSVRTWIEIIDGMNEKAKKEVERSNSSTEK